jgi:hypothetical protein
MTSTGLCSAVRLSVGLGGAVATKKGKSMSKQSEAKKEQNYREAPDSCANCGHYESQMVKKSYQGFGGLSEWEEEKGKRCTIGGFAVKKMAMCDRHVLVAPNVM